LEIKVVLSSFKIIIITIIMLLVIVRLRNKTLYNYLEGIEADKDFKSFLKHILLYFYIYVSIKKDKNIEYLWISDSVMQTFFSFKI